MRYFLKKREAFNLDKRRVRYFLYLPLFFLFSLFLVGANKENEALFLSPQEPYSAYFSPQDSLHACLVYLVQNAKKSIYAAFYKMELEEVSGALIEAHKRGVKVRFFTDDSTSRDKKSQFENLNEFFFIKTDEDPESLMHHKFCVIDEEIVWTGSFNPTSPGSLQENNNVVIIKSSSSAAEFMEEFERLWEGKSFLPDISDSSMSPHNNEIEVYFSLHQNPEEAILEELEKAEESIHFALFTFTSERVAQTLIGKFAQNLEIKGILEKDQESPFSQYHSLRSLKIPIRLDRNFYFMHHKFFVIDNKTVITGSFNPTWRANYQNRENLLVLHNSSLASQYEEEFSRLWKESGLD